MEEELFGHPPPPIHFYTPMGDTDVEKENKIHLSKPQHSPGTKYSTVTSSELHHLHGGYSASRHHQSPPTATISIAAEETRGYLARYMDSNSNTSGCGNAKGLSKPEGLPKRRSSRGYSSNRDGVTPTTTDVPSRGRTAMVARDDLGPSAKTSPTTAFGFPSASPDSKAFTGSFTPPNQQHHLRPSQPTLKMTPVHQSAAPATLSSERKTLDSSPSLSVPHLVQQQQQQQKQVPRPHTQSHAVISIHDFATPAVPPVATPMPVHHNTTSPMGSSTRTDVIMPQSTSPTGRVTSSAISPNTISISNSAPACTSPTAFPPTMSNPPGVGHASGYPHSTNPIYRQPASACNTSIDLDLRSTPVKLMTGSVTTTTTTTTATTTLAAAANTSPTVNISTESVNTTPTTTAEVSVATEKASPSDKSPVRLHINLQSIQTQHTVTDTNASSPLVIDDPIVKAFIDDAAAAGRVCGGVTERGRSSMAGLADTHCKRDSPATKRPMTERGTVSTRDTGGGGGSRSSDSGSKTDGGLPIVMPLPTRLRHIAAINGVYPVTNDNSSADAAANNSNNVKPAQKSSSNGAATKAAAKSSRDIIQANIEHVKRLQQKKKDEKERKNASKVCPVTGKLVTGNGYNITNPATSTRAAALPTSKVRGPTKTNSQLSVQRNSGRPSVVTSSATATAAAGVTDKTSATDRRLSRGPINRPATTAPASKAGATEAGAAKSGSKAKPSAAAATNNVLACHMANLQQKLEVDRLKRKISRDQGQSIKPSLDLYWTEKQVGKGAYGKVYLATQKLTGKKVAVKTFNKDMIIDSESKRRVQQEIRILGKLNHPHIVQLLEVLRIRDNDIHMVMEFASGGCLSSYIQRKGCLQEPEARRIFAQLVSGVDFLHRKNYYHRDIKLANILLDHDRNLKIADFGLCVFKSEGKKLSKFCGSPSYIAPELIHGEDYEGSQVDIWTMGILLFAMIAGTVPWQADNFKLLCQKILKGKINFPENTSDECKSLISAMLTQDPALRITMPDIKNHPWLLSEYATLSLNDLLARESSPEVESDGTDVTATSGSTVQPVPKLIRRQSSPSISAEDIDETALDTVESFGFCRSTVAQSLANGVHDHSTACYHLLRKH